MEFLQYRRSGRLFAMFEHALYDTATVRMSSQALNLSSKGIDDELDVLCRYALDSLLNDVIAVLIFDALEDLMFQFLHEGRLLIGQDMFNCLYELAWPFNAHVFGADLLYHPTAIHL